MAKEHADLSPSSAGRWMKCAGSVVLSQGIEDKGSEYALEGTAAHDVAAMCLTSGTDAAAYVGRLIDAKGTEVPVTEDMAENVQVYVDAVRQRVKAYEMAGAQVTLEVEQRVPIGHITREEGAEGTSDAVIIAEMPDNTLALEVLDLKMGRGVEVEAEDNEQGQLYALGVLKKFGIAFDFDPTTPVAIVISQPRIARVPSEWLTSVEALTEFGKKCTQSVHLIKAAFHCKEGGGHEFAEKYLVPGSHCKEKFCKARGTCPALRESVLSTVAGGVNHTPASIAEFQDLTLERDLELAGEAEGPEAYLAALMPKLDMIEDWCKQVRAATESALLAGRAVPGYKLVEGRQGARKWANEAEAEALLKSFRLKTEERYDLSVISPTTAEKLTKAKEGGKPLIGPRQWPKVEALVTRAAPKPSVAPESDKRPALVIKPVTEDEGGGLC